MKIYTEEEWFNTFYPKSWGDWKKYFNIEAYRKQRIGCAWLDYKITGIVISEKDGKMQVHKRESSNIIEHFFIECGSLDKDAWWAVQPILQIDDTYYASVLLESLESNLDLFRIYVSGNDDSSFTTNCIGIDKASSVIDFIKRNGPEFISSSNDFFFTN